MTPKAFRRMHPKNKSNAQKAPVGEFFAEEGPGNHGGDDQADAAPCGVRKGEVEGQGGFGENIETESVGNQASCGGHRKGKALGHFKESGAQKFQGNGYEK